MSVSGLDRIQNLAGTIACKDCDMYREIIYWHSITSRACNMHRRIEKGNCTPHQWQDSSLFVCSKAYAPFRSNRMTFIAAEATQISYRYENNSKREILRKYLRQGEKKNRKQKGEEGKERRQ